MSMLEKKETEIKIYIMGKIIKKHSVVKKLTGNILRDEIFEMTKTHSRNEKEIIGKGKTKVKKYSKFQERVTAYHEAGHAVANYLFGRELEFVTIIPNFEKGEFGRTQPVGEPTFCPSLTFGTMFSVEGRMEFEREIIISLAGYIAEINYRSRRNKFSAMLNLSTAAKNLKLYSSEFPLDDGDFNCIRICFDSYLFLNNSEYLLGKDERESYLHYLWMRTVNMLTLKNIWNAVKAVAEALLEKKILNGKEAKRIMAKSIPHRWFFSSFCLTGKQLEVLLKEDKSIL